MKQELQVIAYPDIPIDIRMQQGFIQIRQGDYLLGSIQLKDEKSQIEGYTMKPMVTIIVYSEHQKLDINW